jgi:cytochrome c
MQMLLWQKLGCSAVLLSTLAAHAAGDPKRGAQVFRQCMACHSVAAGEHMTGPSLAHIWNRKAGSVEGFLRYSDPMKRADVVWNEATLDKWLSDPEAFLPGTSMSFPGLKQSQARQDLIAYLKAASGGKAPPAQRGGKLDLRKAPPEGQVTSIKHCGDTYTVDTADGKRQKIWEFNLRFKTDSSKLGPTPGKPVVVGAGMQGDRASIVFATPKEISESIKQACP